VRKVSWIALFYWLKTTAVMYVAFQMSPPGVTDHILLISSSLGPLLLWFGLSFFFFKRLHPRVLIGLMFLTTFFLYAHLIYYRFYEDFLTLPILLQVGNVGGLSQSTWTLLSPWDLLFIVDLVVIGWWLLRTGPFTIPPKKKKQYAGSAAGISLVILAAAWWHSPHLFQENYNRDKVVTSISIYAYQWFDIAYSITAPLQKTMADQSAAAPVEKYVAKKDPLKTKWFGQAKGKNVVFITLESVQNFVIDAEVKGEPVTPFLNQLKEESLYFSNLYDQASQGKSSDAEFMVDTGLYPLDGGSVFVRRPNNTFNGLPELLKDYQTTVFHGNVRTFWNREQMYESLGYDQFISKQDYDINEDNRINYGIEDKSFFRQSIPFMKQLNEPYMAKFITLTNHFPFLLDQKDRSLPLAETSEPVVNRYLTTVRYLDESIRQLFQSLKEEGMYQDTMFVLFGDHYGISKEYEDGVHELLDQPDTALSHTTNQRVPLLIHIPGMKGETFATLGGQIDIRSTVFHLLGKETDDYMSFSQNLLAEDKEEFVAFRDGDFITPTYLFQDGICYKTDSSQPVNGSHCKEGREKAREKLKLSDHIIKGDLLRFK